jgi:hypothetical protein
MFIRDPYTGSNRTWDAGNGAAITFADDLILKSAQIDARSAKRKSAARQRIGFHGRFAAGCPILR